MTVPLGREPLPLPVDPRSVRTARRWVSEVLEKLGRDDLVDSAALGVSELVTNAILHADPPITVSVRGTRDHPRVEVTDTSQAPPALEPDLAEDEHLMSTIGRGLGIVALYSTTWGSHVAPEGKTVWFEPSTETEVDGDLSGEVFDLAELVGEVPPKETPDELVTIRLLNMPAQVFAYFRQRYRELRRELSLLALAHGADYPVAADLAELSVQIEQERQQARGVDRLDAAIARGDTTVNLEYLVPSTAPESMMALFAMLERADQFCRQEKLLALAATPQQTQLLDWYLNEFRRQAAGEEPIPWPGSLTLDVEGPTAT